MKKFLAVIAIASFAVACNSKSEKKETTDSSTVAPVDTTTTTVPVTPLDTTTTVTPTDTTKKADTTHK
jgi:hypothetical protein